MTFDQTVSLVGQIIDGVGVAVIVAGASVVSARYLWRLRGDPESAYRRYRQGLGRSILLGLELLVAGDIIGTVAINPTFRSVGVLAIIVLLRTFLSWSLEVELEGRWPCQRGKVPPAE